MRLANSAMPTPSWVLSTIALLFLIIPTNALYFYMDAQTPKCFFEELPKDTLVVGQYNAELYNAETRTVSSSPTLQISITVDEIFDNDHRIVSQKGNAKGRFTFTAADSGDHRICFTPADPAAAAAGSWLGGGTPQGGIKFSLDLAIGETSAIESTDKGKMDDIVQKVRDLNGRLQDIRREQVFQREREAEFRDQSETTNSRVVRWTLIQLAILGITCAWQLTHLRAFFIKQKLT